jgi:hypothetical protein
VNNYRITYWVKLLNEIGVNILEEKIVIMQHDNEAQAMAVFYHYFNNLKELNAIIRKVELL